MDQLSATCSSVVERKPWKRVFCNRAANGKMSVGKRRWCPSPFERPALLRLRAVTFYQISLVLGLCSFICAIYDPSNYMNFQSKANIFNAFLNAILLEKKEMQKQSKLAFSVSKITHFPIYLEQIVCNLINVC